MKVYPDKFYRISKTVGAPAPRSVPRASGLCSSMAGREARYAAITPARALHGQTGHCTPEKDVKMKVYPDKFNRISSTTNSLYCKCGCATRFPPMIR